MRTLLAFCVMFVFCCGVLAQKQKKLSKDEVNSFIQQDLESWRARAIKAEKEAISEHERANLQAEQSLICKIQLERLRAAVAKAAKL